MIVAVVLAAGQGTRMRSRTPKVLHDLCGRPLVDWPVAAALSAGAERVVVVGGPDRVLADRLPEGVELVVQAEPRGTADAVRAAGAHIGAEDTVVVLSGDVPLITAPLIAELAAAHRERGAAMTLTAIELEDPSGYGRVVRDAGGEVVRVVETKRPGDASEQELSIREVNAGVYAFTGGPLLDALGRISDGNAQGEFYLPDAVSVLREAGATVAALRVQDGEQLAGVNDGVELAAVRRVAQRRILEAHLRTGVSVLDPAGTFVDVDVQIGADTVIEPGCVLRGTTRVAEGCRVGPHTTLIDAVLEQGARVVHSHLVSCRVGEGATVGPFAYLRPDAVLGRGAKAGTFVEIKNSEIGEGAKVPHLSYIGDADVGPGTNLGASTVTANYDGRQKHRTTIGARVRGGVDTTFVAPVRVGDDAVTGAGSVITEDVEPGALAIARARQVNRPGYGAAPASREGTGEDGTPAPSQR